MVLRTASIIIRTFNEAEALPHTLEAVFSQVGATFDVLVVDSGSTDRTLDVATSYPVSLLEIPSQEWSYPRALNLGAEHSSGEILVYLSAHCVPLTEHWLANLLRHFDDPGVAAVWGQDLNPSRVGPVSGPAQRQIAGSYTAKTRMWGLSNANSALRRSLWLEVPFDERMPAAEDKAWAREMMDRGWSIVYEPAATTRHGRHSGPDAFRRNRAVMEGYRIMFPELKRPASGTLLRALREARQVVRERVSNPQMSQIGRDVKQGLTTISHLLGAYLPRRRATPGIGDDHPGAR